MWVFLAKLSSCLCDLPSISMYDNPFGLKFVVEELEHLELRVLFGFLVRILAAVRLAEGARSTAARP